MNWTGGRLAGNKNKKTRNAAAARQKEYFAKIRNSRSAQAFAPNPASSLLQSPDADGPKKKRRKKEVPELEIGFGPFSAAARRSKEQQRWDSRKKSSTLVAAGKTTAVDNDRDENVEMFLDLDEEQKEQESRELANPEVKRSRIRALLAANDWVCTGLSRPLKLASAKSPPLASRPPRAHASTSTTAAELAAASRSASVSRTGTRRLVGKDKALPNLPEKEKRKSPVYTATQTESEYTCASYAGQVRGAPVFQPLSQGGYVRIGHGYGNAKARTGKDRGTEKPKGVNGTPVPGRSKTKESTSQESMLLDYELLQGQPVEGRGRRERPFELNDDFEDMGGDRDGYEDGMEWEKGEDEGEEEFEVESQLLPEVEMRSTPPLMRGSEEVQDRHEHKDGDTGSEDAEENEANDTEGDLLQQVVAAAVEMETKTPEYGSSAFNSDTYSHIGPNSRTPSSPTKGKSTYLSKSFSDDLRSGPTTSQPGNVRTDSSNNEEPDTDEDFQRTITNASIAAHASSSSSSRALQQDRHENKRDNLGDFGKYIDGARKKGEDEYGDVDSTEEQWRRFLPLENSEEESDEDMQRRLQNTAMDHSEDFEGSEAGPSDDDRSAAVPQRELEVDTSVNNGETEEPEKSWSSSSLARAPTRSPLKPSEKLDTDNAAWKEFVTAAESVKQTKPGRIQTKTQTEIHHPVRALPSPAVEPDHTLSTAEDRARPINTALPREGEAELDLPPAPAPAEPRVETPPQFQLVFNSEEERAWRSFVFAGLPDNSSDEDNDAYVEPRRRQDGKHFTAPTATELSFRTPPLAPTSPLFPPPSSSSAAPSMAISPLQPAQSGPSVHQPTETERPLPETSPYFASTRATVAPSMVGPKSVASNTAPSGSARGGKKTVPPAAQSMVANASSSSVSSPRSQVLGPVKLAMWKPPRPFVGGGTVVGAREETADDIEDDWD